MVARHNDHLKKFLLHQISFLASQNIGKKADLSLGNFPFVNVILLLQREDNRRGFHCFFKIESARMTDCHDWQVKFLASKAVILAGHSPLTSCYFEPWFLQLLFNDI